MPRDSEIQENTFDVMADLCILAGQAVMQVGSHDLKAAMRVALAILGREVAARSASEADLPVERAPGRAPAARGGARRVRLASCA